MDPTQLLRDILSNMEYVQDDPSSREQIVQDLRDLANWLAQRGAMPSVCKLIGQAEIYHIGTMVSRPKDERQDS